MNEMQLNEKIGEVSKTIFSYSMARTRSREEAEDLSQEILLELVKSAGNIRDDKAFYGFIWALAGNVYKQWLRKKHKAETLELAENVLTEDLPNQEQDPSEDFILLRRELTLLCEKYRKATVLYYVEEKSCFEIARILSISESMVKYLLFKSRKVLKEGMNMERTLGVLSYNPKNLIPLYSGEGPNNFHAFMKSKIRQNVLSACYNDALTEQQISLETGVPLPYLEEEISALLEKKILLKEGKRYKANVIVIDTRCGKEIAEKAALYHEKIAKAMETFIDEHLEAFKAIGFRGCDFSENTLRWQLAALIFRVITFGDFEKEQTAARAPITAWGERAYLWCKEENEENVLDKYIFSYSGMKDRQGASLFFFDCRTGGKGDHHDFYGNERFINILCDVARGNTAHFGEYDLEAVAEMVKKGYVIKKDGCLVTTLPVFNGKQYEKALLLAEEFVRTELVVLLEELKEGTLHILMEHTPAHLQEQVPAIAKMDTFEHSVCAPGKLLMAHRYLQTTYHPLEMPTTFIVLE